MIGNGLKKLRKVNQLKQKDLAEWLGVSRQAVAMWESNQREVRATTLKKIARVFGVTTDTLLKVEGVRPIQKEGVMERKKRLRKTSFELKAPKAKNVVLAGDFNDWDQKGIPMKKSRAGVWKAGIRLDTGRYEYKFLVDSHWWTDPKNDATAPNSFGNQNSVLEIN